MDKNNSDYEDKINKLDLSALEGEKYWEEVESLFEKKLILLSDDDDDINGLQDLDNNKVDELLNMYSGLDSYILSEKSIKQVFITLSDTLRHIFKSMYVEFFLIKDNCLEYQYINVPQWMLEAMRKLFKISLIIGMKVPLFDGSYFKEFVDNCKPRELIKHEDLVRSMRDFLPPDSEHNIYLREKFPETAVKFFGYKYIFQVPLIVNGKMLGYFSFLQKKRFTKRARMEIIMLAEKFGVLLGERKEEEELPELYSSMNRGFVSVDIVKKKNSDEEYVLYSVNDYLLNVLGLKKSDIINKKIEDLINLDHNKAFTIFNSVIMKSSAKETEFYMKSVNKTFKVFIYKLESGRIAIQLDDITEQKRIETENAYLAQHDPMTGLFNRATFDTFVEHEIKSAKRNSTKFAIFFIDLNGFKDINDNYGHDVGDQILIYVAKYIRITLRESDIVGRLGGDEFTVLGRDVCDMKSANVVLEKLREAISTPVTVNNNMTIIPGASIGLSIYPEDGTTYDELRIKSDMRMYKEKLENKINKKTNKSR